MAKYGFVLALPTSTSFLSGAFKLTLRKVLARAFLRLKCGHYAFSLLIILEESERLSSVFFYDAAFFVLL